MRRLFFDEPLSEELCEVVADIFLGSLHIRLLGQGGAADAIVWDLARLTPTGSSSNTRAGAPPQPQGVGVTRLKDIIKTGSAEEQLRLCLRTPVARRGAPARGRDDDDGLQPTAAGAVLSRRG
ncbi:MAG: hypothetical protein DMF97_22305 [Acidobacteria bacterium]|nr:MAG: hypothetical protein DMF97_22305 [Acidobacteriota bacterium]